MEMNHDLLPSSQCKVMLNSIGDALYAIGGKWKLRIIVGLLDGAKRFNVLQRSVGEISAKVLSNELKELELNGFLRRTVFTDTPVIVEYELTDYAKSLHSVLQALSDWGQAHREKIRESMKRQPAA